MLTSSRADFGIYEPLLRALKNDAAFDMQIIAFGTHLSEKHGYTMRHILDDGFTVSIEVRTAPEDDSPLSISRAMGETVSAFAKVWHDNRFDLVLCLGDRYEMFAACAAAVPFNVTLAHIHGGEQTLGAIDEAFRHSITHMATLHFTTTEVYRKRVAELKGSDHNVYNTGALSIDNLKHLRLLSVEELKSRFHIDFGIPSILITFHPETVSFEKNAVYADELVAALNEIEDYQLVITMPNADTMGNMIREKLTAFIASASNAIGIESFGMLGYLSAMKHCRMMLGNTSSGFVEAAYFPRYVINLGQRQTGRIVTENIANTPIRKDAILDAVRRFPSLRLPAGIDMYGDGNAAANIVSIIKEKYVRHR